MSYVFSKKMAIIIYVDQNPAKLTTHIPQRVYWAPKQTPPPKKKATLSVPQKEAHYYFFNVTTSILYTII